MTVLTEFDIVLSNLHSRALVPKLYQIKIKLLKTKKNEHRVEKKTRNPCISI